MAPEPRPVVVGAAILMSRDGVELVLATQRSAPPSLAGLWEFPGGKVEPGESEAAALARECGEELGLQIDVGDRIGPEVRTADGDFVLRVYLARVLGGEVGLTEHSAYRWLDAAGLDDVPWIAADLPVVNALRSVMVPRSR